MVPSIMIRKVLSVLLVQLVLLSLSGYAAPTRSSIIRRQNGTIISSPQTRTTTEKITTGAGTFLQTCTIVMTPITGNNGENLVQEETSCLSRRQVAVLSSASTSASGSVINMSPPGGSIASPIQPFVGVSGIPSPGLSSGTAVSTSTPSGSSSSVLPSATVVGAAATASSASSTPLTLPGRKLLVLPIGLGIFGGITFIALLIVVLVTIERRRHRRNFRKQKLAETAAPMGYGGNYKVEAQ